MVAGALLRADLDHAFVLARRLNHLAPFVYGAGDGLLDVNVLARLTGHHGLQRMPVVGRGDDHRVNVLAVEHSTKIPVCINAFEFGVFDRKVYVRLEDVAERDNLRVRISQKRLHHAAPLPSRTDHSDANAIIRAQDVRARRSRGAYGSDASLNEISAFDSVIHIFLFRSRFGSAPRAVASVSLLIRSTIGPRSLPLAVLIAMASTR